MEIDAALARILYTMECYPEYNPCPFDTLAPWKQTHYINYARQIAIGLSMLGFEIVKESDID